jgi:hypothetical protein
MSELLLAGCDAQARLCQNLQDAPLGRVAWNRLLQTSETKSIFLTWQWLSSWWEAFREGADLYAFAVERDGNLIGIAPLVLRRHGGMRTVEFLGMGSSDYADFIASEDDKPDVIRAVFDALMKRRDRWDRIRLRYLPEKSSTAKLLSGIVLPPSWEFRRESIRVPGALHRSQSELRAAMRPQEEPGASHALLRTSGTAPSSTTRSTSTRSSIGAGFHEQHRDRRFWPATRACSTIRGIAASTTRMIPALIRPEPCASHCAGRKKCWRTTSDSCTTASPWYKPTFNVDWQNSRPVKCCCKAARIGAGGKRAPVRFHLSATRLSKSASPTSRTPT